MSKISDQWAFTKRQGLGRRLWYVAIQIYCHCNGGPTALMDTSTRLKHSNFPPWIEEVSMKPTWGGLLTGTKWGCVIFSDGVAFGMRVDEEKGFRGKEGGISEVNRVTMTTIQRFCTWNCQNWRTNNECSQLLLKAPCIILEVQHKQMPGLNKSNRFYFLPQNCGDR